MARAQGNVPTEDPAPTELWIESGPVDGDGGRTGRTPDSGNDPDTHPRCRRGGRAGSGPWIALIAGLLLLFAAIAVQHAVGTHPVASTKTSTATSSTRAPAQADNTCRASAPLTAGIPRLERPSTVPDPPVVAVPAGSIAAYLSLAVASIKSVQRTASPAGIRCR